MTHGTTMIHVMVGAKMAMLQHDITEDGCNVSSNLSERQFGLFVRKGDWCICIFVFMN